MVRSTGTGVELDVHVIPRARHTYIDGDRNGAVLVRVAAPPVDDAANNELIGFFAHGLRLSRGAIRLLSGARSRRKRLAIDGVTADTVHEFIRGVDDR